jgi:hypothetical protein
MSMEIPMWVPSLCSVGQTTSEMAARTLPLCLTMVDEELPTWNAMSRNLMHSKQKTKRWWLQKKLVIEHTAVQEMIMLNVTRTFDTWALPFGRSKWSTCIHHTKIYCEQNKTSDWNITSMRNKAVTVCSVHSCMKNSKDFDVQENLLLGCPNAEG